MGEASLDLAGELSRVGLARGDRTNGRTGDRKIGVLWYEERGDATGLLQLGPEDLGDDLRMGSMLILILTFTQFHATFELSPNKSSRLFLGGGGLVTARKGPNRG